MSRHLAVIILPDLLFAAATLYPEKSEILLHLRYLYSSPECTDIALSATVIECRSIMESSELPEMADHLIYAIRHIALLASETEVKIQ